MYELVDKILNEDEIELTSYKYDSEKPSLRYIEYLKAYPNQMELKDILQEMKQNGALLLYQREMYNIDKNVLYDSHDHGLFHNLRVLFFTVFIGTTLKLTKEDLKIVIDAAKYHDIRRTHDDEDEQHGKRSSDHIIEIINDEFYNDEENAIFLKAIIELHSLDDKELVKVAHIHGITDLSRLKLLWAILKDSDALDRVRFSDLNPQYLRLDISKVLVKTTEDLLENSDEFTFQFKETKEGDYSI